MDETLAERGSRGRVLRNLLGIGITRKREMDRMEAREQLRALEELTGIYDRDMRFRAADVCRTHQVWLGRLYSWAGRYRQVDLSSGELRFANAAQIPRLMAELERGPLRRFTSCRPAPVEQLAMALAVVHVELVLSHPFREGNGRVARMPAVLMGLQAGLPALVFDKLSAPHRQRYFAAVRAGLDREYEPMAELLSAVIRRTLQIHGHP